MQCQNYSLFVFGKAIISKALVVFGWNLGTTLRLNFTWDLCFLDDDNLQPKVVLRDIKAEPEMTNGTIANGHGNDSDEQDTNETFENDAERIMSKRGKKSKNSADYQYEEDKTSCASNEVTENFKT